MKKILFLFGSLLCAQVASAQLLGAVSSSNVQSGAFPGGAGPSVSVSGTTSANSTYTVGIDLTANVTGFVVGDISVTGSASKTNFQTISGNSYTVDIVPSANGTVKVFVLGAVCQDAFARDNLASDTLTTTITLLPVNTVAPVATGSSTVGSLLSTTDGTWINTPTSYAYQWERDGVDIGSATANTYTTSAPDDGHTLKCRVTATNAAGSGVAHGNTIAIGFSAHNADFWLDFTQPMSSGIAADVDNLLRPSLTSSDVTSYTSTLISPGGLRMTPSYNTEGVYFNGQGGFTYGTTADWKWLHNHSFTLYLLYKQLTTTVSATNIPIFRTETSSLTNNSQVGFSLHYKHTASNVNTIDTFITNNVGGTQPYRVTGTGNDLAINSYNIIRVTFDSTTTTFTASIKQFGGSYVQVGQDVTGAALSTANSTSVLTFGNATFLKGYFKHILGFKKILSGSERTTIESFLDAEAGTVVTPTDTAYTYLHWGQSNEGSADTTGIASDLKPAMTDVFTYFMLGNSDSYHSGYWSKMQLGKNQNPSTNLNTHAWQMRFGKDMQTGSSKKIFITGRWVGSSVLIPPPAATDSWTAITPSSYTYLFPYWSDGQDVLSASSVVVSALDEIVNVKRMIPKICGVIGFQGESDGGSTNTTTAAYLHELKGFGDSLRSILNRKGYDTTNIRTCLVRTGAPIVPNGSLVDAADLSYAAGYSARRTTIDVSDLSRSGGHFQSVAQDSIGKRIKRYFLPHIGDFVHPREEEFGFPIHNSLILFEERLKRTLVK